MDALAEHGESLWVDLVAFFPTSSLASGGAGGNVFVTNFPAIQPVSFAQPITVDASGFTVPVSGPLTDAQLRASAVPVSVAALPLPSGAATEATLETLATEETLDRAADSLDDVGLTAILEREKVE